MKNLLTWIPKTCLIVLTFLLPLKFGSTVGVPEMPMTYWTETAGILVASWPVLLFPFLAAVTLALTILCLPRPAQPSAELRVYSLLWLLLTAATLPGWLHCTTWDFAAQNTAHLLGMLCWALALVRTLEHDRDFARCLTAAMITGLLFSVYSAFNQYLTGFDDTLKFIQDKEKRSGISILEGQFGNRLKESRVSGDFSVCNSYAGYLVLVFPLLLSRLWDLGKQVTPPLPAKLILTLPCLGILLFLLKETGSRGGVLALLGGGFLVLPCLRLARRWKILLWSLVPCGLAAFYLLVKFGRGFNSMLIRFDYFQAAFRMMLLRPFTGAGWGEFLNDYLIMKNVVNDEAPHSPHNFILTLGSQCGIPVFLLSALLLAIPLIAALTALTRRCKEGSPSQAAGEIAMVWGLGGWTIHSMLELNYETPGSWGLAIVLSILILSRTELPLLDRIPAELTGSKVSNAVFLLFSAAAVGTALIFLPPVIKAEMNFDALHSMTDVRFAADPANAGKIDPAVVRDALAKCDPRSPFPFAAVSSFYQSKGPYFTADTLEMLDKAISLTPKRSAYYYRKYRILQAFPSRKAEAEAALNKARDLSPKNPQYYPDGITPYGTRSY